MVPPKLTPDESDWQPLPAGTLNELASRLKTRRRVRVATKIGGIVSVVVAAVGLSMFFVQSAFTMKEPNFGGITCTEVRRVMMGGGAKNAAPDVQQRIQEHLRLCPACQKLMNEMPKMASAVTKTREVPGVICQLPENHPNSPVPSHSGDALTMMMRNP